MKRISSLLLVLGLGLLGAGQTWAYTFLEQQSSAGKWYPVRWPASATKVRWELNNAPLNLLPNILSDAAPMDAIQAAMQTWAAVAPPQFYLDGEVATAKAAKDGVNLITFADTPQNRDLVSDANAITPYWIKNSKPVNQPYWEIQEADIVVSPTKLWDTNGDPNSLDLQSTLTHEMGHAHGLDHSPIIGATMFAYGTPGQTHRRHLESDDIAGVGALYGVAAPDRGAIAGKVVTAAGAPVLGAHVVAVDASGLVDVGRLSDKDGSFTLPLLPPGSYAVYAEPLAGNTTSRNLSSGYYQGTQTGFRTTVAGTSIQVAAGQTTSLAPITVPAQSPGFYPQKIGWSPDGNNITFWNSAAEFRPGDSGILAVAGPGVDTISAIGVPGNDIALDTSNASWGSLTDGTPALWLPFSVSSTAPPGSRNLQLFTDNEMEAYTGGLVVMAQ